MTDPEHQEQLPPPEEAAVERPPAPAEPAAERYPFWSYLDVALLIALALPLLVASAVVVAGLLHVTSWRAPAAVGPIAIQFLFYALWFLLVYEVLRLRYGRPFWRSLAFVRVREWGGRAVWWGSLTALAAIVLGILLRPPVVKTPLDQLLRDPVSIALMVIFGVTLGPLCEELAFRGLLLPLLARSLGAAAGILLTAAPFALLHGGEYAWSWQVLLVVFVAGSAFGWIRYRTGSTAASAIAHAVYNLVFFAGFLAQRSVQHG